jgi:oligopeptidase B
MCDAVQVTRGKNTLTKKQIIQLNKPAVSFFRKHKKLQTKLIKEFKDQMSESDYASIPSRYIKYTYYYTRDVGNVYGKYSVIDDCGVKRTILDCEALSKGYGMWDKKETEISNNEEYIAYTVDTNGDGLCKLYIKRYFDDKATEIRCPTSMWPENVAAYHDYRNASDIAFSRDSTRLYYVSCDEANREDKIWCYDIATKKSECVFEESDETYSIYLSMTDDREYPIIVSRSKSTADSFVIMPEGDIRCVFKRSEGLMVYMDHYQNKWYVQVERGVVGEILVCDDDLKKFSLFYGYNEGEELSDLLLKGGYMMITYSHNGEEHLNIVNLCTRKITKIHFMDTLCNFWFPTYSNMNVYDSELVLGYETYVRPPSWTVIDLAKLNEKYRANLDISKAEYIPEYPIGKYHMSDYRVKQHSVNKSGLKITMLYNSKTIKSKNNKCVLWGYGAYGTVEGPEFNQYIPCLLDRGYIYCIAHIRGGGYNGFEWYNQGKMLRKKNTFLDYIACAEYLIEHQLTSPDRLVAWGASAGGLTVAAALNIRPELFKLAIMGVPFIDVISEMCDSSTPLTTEEYKEWGDPHNKKYFDYMLQYDPIRNIDVKKDYPNMYIYSNRGDSLVGYWVPYNYYMKMKEADVFASGDKSIMINIELNYGHSGGTSRKDTRRENAELYSVILEYGSNDA